MFDFLRSRSSETLLQLSGSALFSSLAKGDLKTLEGFLHERHYLPGEIVFDQGEEGQALYVILSGRVVICHPGKAALPIAELGPGDFFGELALLDDAPRSAQARASTETQLAVFFRGDFERLLDSHARIASRITLQLARNLGLRLRGSVSRPVDVA